MVDYKQTFPLINNTESGLQCTVMKQSLIVASIHLVCAIFRLVYANWLLNIFNIMPTWDIFFLGSCQGVQLCLIRKF